MKRFLFICILALVVMPALADTTRFYADTADDGQLSRAGVTENFSDIRNGAGTQAITSSVPETSFLLTTGSTSGKWSAMRGFYWKASTADIPDNAIIDSATMGFNSITNCVSTLGSFNITLSNFTGADPGTGLTADDYNTVSGLVLSGSMSTTTWNVDGYKNFTLNADGLSAINKTGNTTIALNFWRSLTNNAPAWSASKSSYCYVYDTSAGISKAPFLEVVYHVDAPPASTGSITNLINTSPTCSNVTFSWDNPPDSDYGELLVWRNNTALANLTNTTTSVLWEGLPEGTAITFSAKTADLSGRVNSTWVNRTVTTATCSSPVAGFSASTVTACANVPVAFTDESTKVPTGWYWEFGDGNTSTDQNPVHTYDVIGSMSVNLKAMNEYGFSWKNKTDYLTVSDCSSPPTRFFADTADDGRLSRADVTESFSDIRNGAGTQASLTSDVSESTFLLTSGSSPETWKTMRGFYWKASTAGIPDNAIIDSATMSFNSVSNCYYALGAYNITLSNFTGKDTDGLTADDYNTVSGLVLSDTKTMTQWNVDGYKNFTLNTKGLSAINKTGDTTFVLNFWTSLTNNTPAWSASRSSYCYVYDTSNGTATRPYLNVTYHDPATLAADFSASRTSGGYNAPIQFNDSSNGFIQSYLWSFGDGNQSTVKNPLFVYSTPGTYTVNLTVTNSTASDTKVRTNYIRIDTRPDIYVNPYHVMIPWLQQGSQASCAAFAASHALMILRYTALGVPPGATQEPYTRNVLYYVSGYPVYSDTHVDYTPSAASVYWTFDDLSMGDHDNVTALAETMKRGYNLQTDKITSKSGTLQDYFYPMGAAYETSHRYNRITKYTIVRGGTQSSWDSLKRNIYDNGVVVLMLDYYNLTGGNNTHLINIDNHTAIQMAEPEGSATNAHALAAIGYNNKEDLVYVLNSWGEVRAGGKRWTKLGAISKNYWMYGTRSSYIVPKNISINEVLVPMSMTNLTNSTAKCTNISFSWNNPLHTDFNHTYALKNNVWVGNYSRTTHSVLWDGLAETAEYTFSALTCDRAGRCNTTWINKTVTTATCGLHAVANFSAENRDACAGVPVAFTDESAQIPTGWYWEFGDGNTSTDQNPVHTYDVIGSMSVNLKAMNEYGFSWKNKTDYLTVTDCSPPPSPATFYADTADDGQLSRAGVSDTFSDIRNGAGTQAITSSVPETSFLLTAGSTSGKWSAMRGFYWKASTARIPDNAIIDSATMGFNSITNCVSTLGSFNITLSNFTGADTGTGLTADDYNTVSGLVISGSKATTTWNVDGYKNFTLNADGLSAINKTGNTTIALNFWRSLTDNAPAWSPSKTSSCYVYDTSAGISKAPFLEVVYHVDAPPASTGSITSLINTSPTCSNVTFSWDNPPDSDYGELLVWRNNTALSNLTNTTTSVLWEDLPEGTEITFSAKTADLSGRVNTTWVNRTVTTATCGSPVAGFSASTVTACTGVPVVFTDESAQIPTGWYWEFGDGNTSTDQSPVHTYDVTGSMSVNLKAMNEYGSSWKNKTDYLTVSDCSPPPSPATFYADTADDGQLSRAGVSDTFSDIRNGAGTQAITSSVPETSFQISTGSSSGKWSAMRGFYWKASTAGIPDNAIIDSATMGFNSVTNCVSTLGSFNITLSNFTGADTGTGLTAGDYNTVSGLVISGSMSTTTWNVDGYKNFTLNADGLSAINKTGNTTIALNFWRSLTNNAPAWSASKSSYCYVYDTSAGISKAPFLEVVYHVDAPPASPVAGFSASTITSCAGDPVVFTDESANAPDGWYWEFGDGNTSTDQSPVHTYDVTGLMSVNLKATNGYGFSWKNETDYLTVSDCSSPPATPESITSLINTSPSCSDVTFAWDNPPDSDYGELLVWRNNTALSNLTNITTSVLWEGLPEGTEITFSAKTADLSGRVNSTWVNRTVTTATCGSSPVAGFSASTITSCAGDPVVFTDESANAPDDWHWEFGDGNTSTDQSPVHTYDVTGSMSVNLKATNGYGFSWKNETDYLTVSDCSPPPATPESITSLINTSPTCSDVTFTWDNPPDSDYGELLVWRNNTALSNLTNTTTSVLWEGLPEGTEITFSAKTADLSGRVNSTWVNRTVTTATCGGSPVAGFSASTVTSCAGDPVVFTDESANAPDGWHWEFGDGNTSTDQSPVHTYDVTGLMSVNLRATNGYGFSWKNETDYLTVSDC